MEAGEQVWKLLAITIFSHTAALVEILNERGTLITMQTMVSSEGSQFVFHVYDENLHCHATPTVSHNTFPVHDSQLYQPANGERLRPNDRMTYSERIRFIMGGGNIYTFKTQEESLASSLSTPSSASLARSSSSSLSLSLSTSFPSSRPGIPFHSL